MYPVACFDTLRVTIRDEPMVRNKAVYLALAVLPDGSRDILGIWIEQMEGAKFWMKVFSGKAANYWHLAMNRCAILYEDRFTRPLA